MATYFDIHNHLFNKNFLAKELLYRLLKELKKLLVDQQEMDREERDFFGGLKKTITILKRYTYAIKVFTRENSAAIYEEINKTYHGDFILTPLTFDLTYCFAPSPDRDATQEPEQKVSEVFENEMNTLFEMAEENTRSFSRDVNRDADAHEDDLWNEYIREKRLFLSAAAELEEVEERSTERERGLGDLIKLPDASAGWDEQIRQIRDLKENPEYKDKIFPFLPVDPRRPGIIEYAEKNVGKGKLFAGIKLYCPNGYSPTDPKLYGPEGEKGGIYKFCEENGIPVTAHNSDGGFASLSKSVLVTGLVHHNGELLPQDNELITFTKSVLEKNGIYERAVTLNHPLIWKKVVEKYPGLILNLAHFGGGGQLNRALDNPENEKLWSNRIIALIRDTNYRVYTDVSCFTDFGVIEKLVASPVYPGIRNKILYGSDFTLLLLFEDSFQNNVRQFRRIFGSDFDIIAGKNPGEFLKNVM